MAHRKAVDEEARELRLPVVWVEDKYAKPRHWPFNTKGDRWTMAEHFRDSLRLRVNTPKSLAAIQIDRGEAGKRTSMLNYLVRQIVESPVRPVEAPRLTLPTDFVRTIELAHKLTRPDTVSWEALTDAIAQMAVRHAYLLGKSATDDWRAVAALLAMQAAPWTAGLVRVIWERGQLRPERVKHRSPERDFYGPECADVEFEDIRKEIRRLIKNGVLRERAYHFVLPAVEPERGVIDRILEGKAFQ